MKFVAYQVHSDCVLVFSNKKKKKKQDTRETKTQVPQVDEHFKYGPVGTQ